jgi:hypothetical protein
MKIRNKVTGEIKEVSEEEAGKLGLTPLQKATEQAPLIGGGLGALIGSLVGLGIPGGAAGAAGGYALRDTARSQRGENPASPGGAPIGTRGTVRPQQGFLDSPEGKRLMGGAESGVYGGMAGGVTQSAMTGIPFLANLLKGRNKLGAKREELASKVPVTYQETKAALGKQDVSKSTEEFAEASTKTGKDWLSKIFPYETVPGKQEIISGSQQEFGGGMMGPSIAPAKIIKGDYFYTRLAELEKTARAYGKSEGANASTVNAAKATSSILRQLMNNKDPKLASVNKTLSWMNRNQKTGELVGHSTAKFGLIRLLGKILPFM